MRKIVIALNTTWNLVNFRAGLIRSLVGQGYEVLAVAPPDNYVSKLTELGARYVPIHMDNSGKHPGRDLLLFCRFFSLFLRERPDVFLGYTVKPNVYGSLSAHLLRIPVVNNISGLGTVFINTSFLTKLVRLLYRLALSHSTKVFFQNEDDQKMFVQNCLVPSEITDRLPGSGVDLERFNIVPFPNVSKSNGMNKVRFLLIARMLWDKGVEEYVNAARALSRDSPEREFCLLGFLDLENPSAISRIQMDKWVAEGVVCYLGERDDVRTEIAQADCVVLPSYREGTPRTLLEAAAMGRPIITTNAVGNREVVDDGINGFICKPRNSEDLAEKMLQFINLSSYQRTEMGKAGRKKMEREFDEQIVIKRYLKVIREIVDY